MDQNQFGDELPLLPVRNAVLFPDAVTAFDVGRDKSVTLVEDMDCLKTSVIAVFAQWDPNVDDPSQDDLYQVGCAAVVLKALKHSAGNYSLILKGVSRIRLDEIIQTAPYIKAKISRIVEENIESDEHETLSVTLRDIAKQILDLETGEMPEIKSLVNSVREPGPLVDLLAHFVRIPNSDKITLLWTADVLSRLRRAIVIFMRHLEKVKRANAYIAALSQDIIAEPPYDERIAIGQAPLALQSMRAHLKTETKFDEASLKKELLKYVCVAIAAIIAWKEPTPKNIEILDACCKTLTKDEFRYLMMTIEGACPQAYKLLAERRSSMDRKT